MGAYAYVAEIANRKQSDLGALGSWMQLFRVEASLDGVLEGTILDGRDEYGDGLGPG